MNVMTEWIGQAAAAVSLASAVPCLLRGPITWVAAFRERRAVTDRLSAMSDRELTGIGLGRSQIPRVFDSAFARARDTLRRIAGDPHVRMLADLGLNPTLPRPTAGG